MFFLVVFQLKGTWEQDPHCRFHPLGKAHVMEGTSPQTSKHHTSAITPKGSTEKLPLSRYGVEQKKGKYIRKAGGLKV